MTAWPIHDWEELCGQAGEEMEQGSFLIDGLWPASGYVMLAAPSKAGKSTFVAHIIASLPILSKQRESMKQIWL